MNALRDETELLIEMDRGDIGGAHETLLAMQERHPHNNQVLRLLYRLHLEQGDWSALIRLLPELRKSKVLPAKELAELQVLLDEELRASAARASELADEAGR